MSTEDYHRQSDPHPGPAAAETRLSVLGLIASLERVCQPDTPAQTFVTELVRGFTSLSDAAYGAFWRASQEPEGTTVAAELLPRVSKQSVHRWLPTLRELAGGVIQQSIIRYRAVGEPAGELLTGQSFMALGFPVRGDVAIAGCVTIVVKRDAPILTDMGITLLQLLANFGQLYSAARAAARFEGFYKSLSRAWDVVGEMLAFSRPDEMAQVLVNRLRAALHADRASLGYVKRGRAAVAAISGEDSIDKRTNTVRLIQAAQSEVVVSGETGAYFEAAQAEARARQLARSPQHQELARSTGAKAVLTVPLRKEAELVAVCTLEFSSTALSEELRQVIHITAGQVAPILHLALENERGVLDRAGDRMAAAVKWVFGKEHPWRKAALVAAVALLGFAIFGRRDFCVVSSCRLEASLKRIHAAPFNTTIRAVAVRPGDRVEAGQTLVEFDSEELKLKLREAQSNSTSVEKQMATFLTQQQMSQYAEAKARYEALLAEVELLEHYIARSVIKADAVGIIIAGDLREDIGRPVYMGEELMEMAPLEKLVLELEVEQGDIAYVEETQEGSFTTKAKPDLALPFVVTKIHPQPEVRNRSSVYVVEATISNVEGWLRPGMEGAAKIKIGRRNVTWIATRKLLDWIRLHLWW